MKTRDEVAQLIMAEFARLEKAKEKLAFQLVCQHNFEQHYDYDFNGRDGDAHYECTKCSYRYNDD